MLKTSGPIDVKLITIHAADGEVYEIVPGLITITSHSRDDLHRNSDVIEFIPGFHSLKQYDTFDRDCDLYMERYGRDPRIDDNGNRRSMVHVIRTLNEDAL